LSFTFIFSFEHLYFPLPSIRGSSWCSKGKQNPFPSPKERERVLFETPFLKGCFKKKRKKEKSLGEREAGRKGQNGVSEEAHLFSVFLPLRATLVQQRTLKHWVY